MDKIGDDYNVVVGMVMTVVIQVFGSHHYIFGVYVLLNILDWLTGWYKAAKKKRNQQQDRIKRDCEKDWMLDYYFNCFFDTLCFCNSGRRTPGFGSLFFVNDWLVYFGESDCE